ncbi:MAG: hypothetical protein Ct9H300mP12_17380 [Acidimicrobiales bacterium]|nr:MAG: hypothetical protein Ct9H300mP12_17380 [Acidimicrobiales bacterium]
MTLVQTIIGDSYAVQLVGDTDRSSGRETHLSSGPMDHLVTNAGASDQSPTVWLTSQKESSVGPRQNRSLPRLEDPWLPGQRQGALAPPFKGVDVGHQSRRPILALGPDDRFPEVVPVSDIPLFASWAAVRGGRLGPGAPDSSGTPDSKFSWPRPQVIRRISQDWTGSAMPTALSIRSKRFPLLGRHLNLLRSRESSRTTTMTIPFGVPHVLLPTEVVAPCMPGGSQPCQRRG